MKKQKLAVTWSECGFIEVEADTIEEAMEKVQENPDAYPLPREGEYIDGSFELTTDDPEEMKAMCTLVQFVLAPKKTKIGKEDFLKLCEEKENALETRGIKTTEYAIQDVIEGLFPGKVWYDVTDISIFNELLAGKSAKEVCEMIWDNMVEKGMVSKVENLQLDDKIAKAGNQVSKEVMKEEQVNPLTRG